MRPILLTTILAAMTGCEEPYTPPPWTKGTVCIDVPTETQDVSSSLKRSTKRMSLVFSVCECLLEVKGITEEGEIRPHPYYNRGGSWRA